MKTCMLFLLFVFLYWGNDIQGQTQEIVLKNYTPSPEAYSLMEYSEIPVSLYTGVPDISIPIYTIRVGNYSLPISLRYHASGIKVGQEASRIGLGWSIHAGWRRLKLLCSGRTGSAIGSDFDKADLCTRNDDLFNQV